MYSPTRRLQLRSTKLLAQLVCWWTRRRARKKAFAQAYNEFRVLHAHLHELRFTKDFLTGRGAEALATKDPVAVARAWTTQFRYRDEKKRAADVRQLTPVAGSLLELLNAGEKRPDTNFKPCRD